jgi:hypothetical protein
MKKEGNKMRDKLVNKLPILLLAAIFLLSMSSYASAKKGGKGVPAEICMTVTGLGDEDPTGACHVQRIRDNTTQLIVRPFASNLDYFQDKIYKGSLDGANCFEDGIRIGDNITLAVVNDGGTAWARVYFWAYTDDGTPLKYGLHMYGYFVGPWPPENGVGNPTFVYLTSWEMVSEGKGKLRKVSCTGSGPLVGESFLVTITATRENR